MFVVRRCSLRTRGFVIRILYETNPFMKKCPLEGGVRCSGCPLKRSFTICYVRFFEGFKFFARGVYTILTHLRIYGAIVWELIDKTKFGG